jgi:pimeloyl-ACP methyl ester carboxylesterase
VTATYRHRFGPHNPDETYVSHAFDEQLADLGEVQMNYATVGDSSKPALLLIPGQTESWWGYEAALPLLAEHFNAFAVDLRGQGRSTRTPGRYTLDNMGNDLVRFIDLVINRPAIVSGLSSGGLLAAWLSAYAKPGQVIAAHYEDPPLFSSQLEPPIGQGLRQSIGAAFRLWSTYLGDQWSIGDWDGVKAAAPEFLPTWMQALFTPPDEPPQRLKEYDPEWGRAFWTGSVAESCDHEQMLRSVRVPVLFTHHFRLVDEATGSLMGAISDLQAARVRELLAASGIDVDYRSFETMGHSMHGQDPQLFTDTLVDWTSAIGRSRVAPHAASERD